MAEQMEYDEKSENGLVICNTYLPEELLTEVLCYVDYKSLLMCQLVCKRWNAIICDYVWRKKVEMRIGRSLPPDQNMTWQMYYLMYKKNPFGRNLIKNHSGAQGAKEHWQIICDEGDHWTIESPPIGIPPLPSNDPILEGKQCCFVTSYGSCTKSQIINLEAEGLAPYVLDALQPPILFSEWYGCRWDCAAAYACTVVLLGNNEIPIDSFKIRRLLTGDDQNKWHLVSHEFRNYGPGLRQIRFEHGGRDLQFWAGHYGSKMAGAGVYIKPPEVKHTKIEEDDQLDVD